MSPFARELAALGVDLTLEELSTAEIGEAFSILEEIERSLRRKALEENFGVTRNGLSSGWPPSRTSSTFSFRPPLLSHS